MSTNNIRKNVYGPNSYCSEIYDNGRECFLKSYNDYFLLSGEFLCNTKSSIGYSELKSYKKPKAREKCYILARTLDHREHIRGCHPGTTLLFCTHAHDMNKI